MMGGYQLWGTLRTEGKCVSKGRWSLARACRNLTAVPGQLASHPHTALLSVVHCPLYCGHWLLSHLQLQTLPSPTQPPESDPHWPKDGNIIDFQGGGQGGPWFLETSPWVPNGTLRATQR